MFLKVKRAAGKQYFAVCVSERRDKKIVTKTICSLGDADKALPTLQMDYPQFLNRFYSIVGTKRSVGTKKLEYLNAYVRDYCIDFSFYDDFVKIFNGLAAQKHTHTPFMLFYPKGTRNRYYHVFQIKSLTDGIYRDLGFIAYYGNGNFDSCDDSKAVYQQAIDLLSKHTKEIDEVLSFVASPTPVDLMG